RASSVTSLVGHRALAGLPDGAHGGALLLLADVADQAGAARDQREAAHDLDRDAAVRERGGDGAGGVDRDVAAGAAVDRGREDLERGDVRAGDLVVPRDAEDARRARVVWDVDRVAEAGQRAARGAVLVDDGLRVGAGDDARQVARAA